MITASILYLWNKSKDIDKTKMASIVWFYISTLLGLITDIAIIRILINLA